MLSLGKDWRGRISGGFATGADESGDRGAAEKVVGESVDFVQGDGFELLQILLRVFESETEDAVQSRLAGLGRDGLVVEGMTGKGGGAASFELGGGETLFANLLQGGEEFAMGEVELVGRGAEVGGEHAGAEAVELTTRNVVGESEFLADAGEEGAGHIGGVLLQELGGDRVGGVEAEAGDGDGENGLFAVELVVVLASGDGDQGSVG